MTAHFSVLAWRVPMGKRSLAVYGPRGRKESDSTKQHIVSDTNAAS